MAAIPKKANEEFGRDVNFSAGPSCLPIEVLHTIQEELFNHKGVGMGVMEMSHRSKAFRRIIDEATADTRELINLPSNYKLLFMHGGGSMQFSCIPLNLLEKEGNMADYVVTGQWSDKAVKECSKFGHPVRRCDTKDSHYTLIPPQSEWLKETSVAKYIYYCANETIAGVEFKETPESGNIPLIADMSSNLCSKPIDVEKHALIFGSAQKNIGPAGCTIVMVQEALLNKELPICPAVCSYKLTSDNQSLYNTPNCWSIYVVGLMMKYLKQKGGLAHWKNYSEEKSQLLYSTIDSSDGYYSSPVAISCRSAMNIPFRVGKQNEDLEKEFLLEAAKQHLVNLEGHRSVGGCRASLYTGMSLEGVYRLTEFMKIFQEEHPLTC
ncbi:putative phosphoserine aminotransferase [Cardiosporidium cionae]|uniref:phosphoserine transaminase n=1 Tax=Cardiosporidium cionae TaxID=476202 RepID=A0ABQ7JAT9_9APIC|nr:putative phosphoserine aminotransferase [Cardiosporidium cionae]|eukprot:KAF8821107.1 putative phosphoserine aminotransferase [Cardiosporidium cionae]